ncbi:MAG: hypothetical protein BWX47_01665 [candidate division Hyd24-12 bacterium ADurb.Bin004]|nr:MAG: hypothetical protein BWX47_01665 [candidate division Hyd24-12 bacterium ADurb.Bin004]
MSPGPPTMYPASVSRAQTEPSTPDTPRSEGSCHSTSRRAQARAISTPGSIRSTTGHLESHSASESGSPSNSGGEVIPLDSWKPPQAPHSPGLSGSAQSCAAIPASTSSSDGGREEAAARYALSRSETRDTRSPSARVSLRRVAEGLRSRAEVSPTASESTEGMAKMSWRQRMTVLSGRTTEGDQFRSKFICRGVRPRVSSATARAESTDSGRDIEGGGASPRAALTEGPAAAARETAQESRRIFGRIFLPTPSRVRTGNPILPIAPRHRQAWVWLEMLEIQRLHIAGLALDIFRHSQTALSCRFTGSKQRKGRRVKII